MKKKIVIICSIAIAVIIAVLLFMAVVLSKQKKEDGKNKLFADTSYPCTYEIKGSNIELTLDGSKTSDLLWNAKADLDGYVDIQAKKEEKNGKVTFVIAPLKTGMTTISFSKANIIEDEEYTAVNALITVINREEDGVLSAEVYADNSYLYDFGGETCGKATEDPFILLNDDGTAKIYFTTSGSKWTMKDPEGKVFCGSFEVNDIDPRNYTEETETAKIYYVFDSEYSGFGIASSSDAEEETITQNTSEEVVTEAPENGEAGSNMLSSDTGESETAVKPQEVTTLRDTVVEMVHEGDGKKEYINVKVYSNHTIFISKSNKKNGK
ncbi:hypothetical protein SAMN04487934_103193 [Eubacterium ruminantium]|nr:hypothetical protein SAMN04487934_103193 [Eubacterium ruminantium]